MSGVLRFHDTTHRLLGLILKVALTPAKWTVEALVSAVVGSLDPVTTKLLKEAQKDPEKEISRLIYYAKDRGYLNRKLHTTTTGSDRLRKIQFSHLEMAKPWDGKWRIVMYDIPEEKKAAREQIRRLIKQLGFVQLQRSVWIHPLPCFEEFIRIKQAHSLESTLILIETDEISGVRRFHRHFRRLYPNIKF